MLTRTTTDEQLIRLVQLEGDNQAGARIHPRNSACDEYIQPTISVDVTNGAARAGIGAAVTIAGSLCPIKLDELGGLRRRQEDFVGAVRAEDDEIVAAVAVEIAITDAGAVLVAGGGSGDEAFVAEIEGFALWKLIDEEGIGGFRAVGDVDIVVAVCESEKESGMGAD